MHPAIPFMAFFFCLFTLLVAAAIFGSIMYAANRSGLRSQQITAGLAAVAAIAVYGVAGWFFWEADSFWFAVAATWTWLPMSGAVIGYNVLHMPENIRNTLNAVDEIIAFGPDAVVAELDADKDGVVSRYDLDTTANHIMAMGLSKNAVDTLRNNLGTFGHRVGDGVYVISARDLPAARLKVRQEWAKWMPAEAPSVARS